MLTCNLERNEIPSPGIFMTPWLWYPAEITELQIYAEAPLTVTSEAGHTHSQNSVGFAIAVI